jgi:exodeoxyribonuclease V beta subunit
MAQYFIHLKSNFLKYSRSKLAVAKKEQNIFFFEDLLSTVNQALMRDDYGSKKLIETVQRRFKAALVDEFQDTDALQYEIFSGFFGKSSSLFFMIGDPKQSIYSFRGADIFSYINAAEKTEHRYTLVENWRSAPTLIKALNTLFERVKDPFLYNDIRYEKAKAGGIRTDNLVRNQPPLTLWFLPSKNEKPINKTDAVRLIIAAVGGEIARLITTNEDRHKPEDIAVLVRTNRQAEMMKECLSKRGVPSVLYGAGNIFDSREARELQLVLKGIIENSNNESVRSALVTEMLGSRAVDVDTDKATPFVLDKSQNRFREYYEHWKNRGFMSMFRWFMSREGIRARLLAYFDGDRRLTNILHLSEILHQYDLTNMISPTDLFQWLTEQRNPEAPRVEEHQLRLETDKQAVRIVTIHKSKGLEYEIVFCPFGWESSLIRRGREVICHPSGSTRHRVLDLGSPYYEKHWRKNQNENLAENLRLLYVALTRAKTYCYLVWGHIKTAETSALAYLLHRHHGSADGDQDVVNLLKSNLSKMKNSDFLTDLEQLVDRSEGTIVLTELPSSVGTTAIPQRVVPETLFCRCFGGHIDTSWKISSYTSLVSQQQLSIDGPDRDEITNLKLSAGTENGELPMSETSISDISKGTIHEFPKGARAGIFFHSLLEHLDFTMADDVYLDEMIQAHLRHHGFDLHWKDIVRNTVQNCLSVPLQSHEPGLVLSRIGPLDRINELAFTYPTKAFFRDQLIDVFFQNRGGNIPEDFHVQLEKLDFSLSGGFLKGYIDLIFQHKKRFFLLDWKSNNLGHQAADYHQDKIKTIMSSSHYVLQYCLYSLALNRYLKMRHPNYTYNRNFGGVFYVFVRGVDPVKGPTYGVYFDRPDKNLITALDQIIIAS